jgi:uncharacterized membrane protein
MSMNPYQAPVAATADVAPPMDADGYTGEIARLPAGDGMTWVGDGWEMFKANPGTWVGIALVFGVLTIGVNLIPIIGGFAAYVLMPILFGGLMLACDAQRRGEAPTISQMFEGFNRQFGQLALVGVIYVAALLALVLVLVLVAAVFFSVAALDLGNMTSAYADGDTQALLIVLLFVLVLIGATLPLTMSVWFAPALVILHEVPAFEAMKRSFQGCLANIVPFLVYGVVTLFLTLLATLPLLLGWLVVGPIFIGSAYSGYRRIYCSA